MAFGDWVPLVVAVIGLVSALSVAGHNTRGESGALRKLRAMNDAIQGLSDGSEVKRRFEIARDIVADRVADRVAGPSIWKRLGQFALGVLGGVVIVLLIWGLTELFPIDGTIAAAATAAAGGGLAAVTAAAIATGSWWRSKAERDREADLAKTLAAVNEASGRHWIQ